VTGYREPPVPPPKYDDDTLQRMRDLWENAPELSAVKIAARFDNMTKNAVIGHAHRREWKLRRPAKAAEPTTLHQRCDALEARMDAVIEETQAAIDARHKPRGEDIAA